jgi:predicted ATPase
MITSFHIENYKCLRDVRVDLRPLTVVIGKNDTGKSSLLEAIQVLGTLMQGPWTGEGAWAINSLIFRGAEPPAIRWTVEVASSARNQLPGKATYSLRVSPEDGTGPRIHVDEESLDVENAAVRVGWAKGYFLEDGATKKEELSATPSQSALSIARHLLGLPTLKAVSQALTTTIKYRFEPRRLAQDSPYPLDPGNPTREPHFDVDGYGLPTVLDYLLGAKRKAFNEIEKELHEAVPFVKTIELKPCLISSMLPGKGMQPGKSISFDLSSGSQIPAEHASDGVMLFLAYLTLIHSSNPASIVLIEEPENGIHPRQLKRIAEYLKRLTDMKRGASAVQVVLATHSPYFLDFVAPEDVLVFGRRENGETVAAPVLSLPGVQQRIDSGFSLGEMWFNVGEDRLLAELLK